MAVFESILTALGILPVSGLAESMRSSKTLTTMVVIGLTLFVGFIFFLYHMAGIQ